uniref:Uncharacterized protein n=1 Tax=Rhizophora mucronata TaxID=61149 RepID=A0A2P2QU86_RHIMU
MIGPDGRGGADEGRPDASAPRVIGEPEAIRW